MSDPNETFRDMVATDPVMRDRWLSTRERAQQVASQLGVTIDSDDDLIALPSVRLAVLADDYNAEQMLSEMQTIETVKEQVRQRELREALQQGEEDSHAELNRLPRFQRMARARELGLIGAAPANDPSSVADEATLLRRLLTLSPSERLAKARAWGLA
ncbi:hypothetical protein [Ruegeria sp. HKCCD6119]|uniref:hypothetical protein n=1 Tax=Ruegeria sp. HKCCD6119 TaxID=2683003 RepID=UPI0014930A2B|nr:hypothetical protein [Ruegeria sp. HKCCD6119]NOD83772.1 hypothetical protein [Ruegeria sp. HKCCD6119]